MKVKFYAPYFYQDFLQRDTIFDDQKFNVEHPQKLILGIESSFDESAACLVDGHGRIMSEDVRFTQPGMIEEFNGGVDPKMAENHHSEFLPKAVE